jgi:hypothetical protein
VGNPQDAGGPARTTDVGIHPTIRWKEVVPMTVTINRVDTCICPWCAPAALPRPYMPEVAGGGVPQQPQPKPNTTEVGGVTGALMPQPTPYMPAVAGGPGPGTQQPTPYMPPVAGGAAPWTPLPADTLPVPNVPTPLPAEAYGTAPIGTGAPPRAGTDERFGYGVEIPVRPRTEPQLVRVGTHFADAIGVRNPFLD